jgi:CDGSH-type Zn-finger protein
MNKIKIIENGPAVITISKEVESREIEVTLPSGEVVIKEGTLAICRCGMSKNHVFCDGSHQLLELLENGI